MPPYRMRWKVARLGSKRLERLTGRTRALAAVADSPSVRLFFRWVGHLAVKVTC